MSSPSEELKEGQPYILCRQCPFTNECSAQSCNKANVWGWTMDQVKDQFRNHLTKSCRHGNRTNNEVNYAVGKLNGKDFVRKMWYWKQREGGQCPQQKVDEAEEEKVEKADEMKEGAMTRKRKRSDLATDEDLDDEDLAVLKACVLAIPAVQKRVDEYLAGIKNKSKEEDAKMPRGWRSCWHPDWEEFYYFPVDQKKQACGPATWVRPTNQAT